jgi:Na+/H+ antiporter NhaC
MISGATRLATAAATILLLWWVFPDPDHTIGTVWSLLPPLVAIGLALALRQVVVSLVLGVFVGAMLMSGNPGAAFLRVVDTHLRDALNDSDHVSIVLFSMLLGAMVGVMSRAGGTAGVVRALAPMATTARRSQVATWFMGLAIFFDDYSNTLVVGNAMRPVTDRFRVSREKLAFLVDSTAAPVACVALVSTWVGYLVSVLGDALTASGAEINAFTLFLGSIPAAFYPVAALTLTFSIAASRRDFGPMLAAERRALDGRLLGDDAQPLADYESAGLEPDPDTPNRWVNAALPVATVVVVTLAGLWVTGREAMVAAGVAAPDLRQIVGASDPFSVLLWGSFAGLAAAILLAVGQRLLTVTEAFEAVLTGFRSMLIAMVVLTLAWALGGVCDQMDTADWITAQIGDQLPPAALPTVVFLVASAVAFSTGTSWGTIAILVPLSVPLALAAENSPGVLLTATVSAILGGSVFGDHCSPISDTTIMSSMATGCDHVDHVRTQLPYAATAAIICLVVGYLPLGLFRIAPWWVLPGVVLATAAVPWVLGRPVENPPST